MDNRWKIYGEVVCKQFSNSQLVKNTWPLCPTGVWFVPGGFLAVFEMGLVIGRWSHQSEAL